MVTYLRKGTACTLKKRKAMSDLRWRASPRETCWRESEAAGSAG